MPATDTRRSSKTAASSGGESHRSGYGQRETRGTQSYEDKRRVSLKSESKRGASLRPDAATRASLPEGPQLKHLAQIVREASRERRPPDLQMDVGEVEDGQDEDEVAGVVGSPRQLESFPSLEVSEPNPEINIAVIGASGVGKSTFVQKALDLPRPNGSQIAERRISIEGSPYLVRLLELEMEDFEIDDEDNSVNWPDAIDGKLMPPIDGALLLYDVKDKESLESIPELLNAMQKATLPSILISCKCDALPEQFQVDPLAIESMARRSIKNLSTLQASASIPETHKQGVSMILSAVVAKARDDSSRGSSGQRLRTQSTALRPVSPRAPGSPWHGRASSDTAGNLSKEQRHTRHDSSLAGAYSASDRSTARQKPKSEGTHGSFLFEESPSEKSADSRRSSASANAIQDGAPSDMSGISDRGVTFDELVDRLLAQPTSKADTKFAAIFLALYRKFAPPGLLLEAVVERFDALDRSGVAEMLRTVNQLRYLSILEQWLSSYPGDFAYSKTKRRIRTFINKICKTKIFGAAAHAMNTSMEYVQDDDDTEWGFCDKDREGTDYLRMSLSATASTLIDDSAFLLENFTINGAPLQDDTAPDIYDEHFPAEDETGGASFPIVVNVEVARNQAQLLSSIPRQPLTKVQWHLLLDSPDDVVAKELTRIDWIMFSSIRPRDLVRQVSLTATQRAQCKDLVHVERMIEHFNSLAFWVANFILLRDKPKHRAVMMEKMMRIARKVREQNNYNALGAMVAGMKSTAIHRLSATRELIPPPIGKDWMKLEILMAPSRSHFGYRLAWENSSTERIPYLPLHRRDLVSAEEGNKTFLGDEKDGKINWRKFEIIGEIVLSMQRAQGMPYNDLPLSLSGQQVKDLIMDVKIVKDEDELFERSKLVEPTAHTAGGASTKIREFFKR